MCGHWSSFNLRESVLEQFQQRFAQLARVETPSAGASFEISVSIRRTLDKDVRMASIH